MSDEQPTFVVQQLDYGVGYVVIATWPDGRSEHLTGVYMAAEHAQKWIRERSTEWVGQRSPDR
jgi:hypothetical protein